MNPSTISLFDKVRFSERCKLIQKRKMHVCINRTTNINPRNVQKTFEANSVIIVRKNFLNERNNK